MKNKKIILIISIILLLIIIIGILYFLKGKPKIHIKIYEEIFTGATEQYVPTSYYEIDKSGKIKYIPNMNEDKVNILGKLKRRKLKELEKLIINAPIDNSTYSPLERRYYYIVELNNDKYNITDYAGKDIINFINENI